MWDKSLTESNPMPDQHIRSGSETLSKIFRSLIGRCWTERHRKWWPVAIKLYISSLWMTLRPFHSLVLVIFILTVVLMHYYCLCSVGHIHFTLMYLILLIYFVLFLLGFIYLLFTSMLTRSNYNDDKVFWIWINKQSGWGQIFRIR